MQILIRKDGKEEGPFTREEVSAMLADGRISKTDFAYYESLSNWLPVAAVLAPRATPPPFKEKPETFESSRVKPNETFANILTQTSSLDWKNIVPFQAIIQDKPWNLRWVRWVLWFACTTFLIRRFADGDDLSGDQALLLVTVNWCLAWAVAFSFIINPERIQASKLLVLILPSVVLTVVLLVAAGKFQFLNSIYQATDNYKLLNRTGSILVTVLVHQIILAAPFIFFYINRKRCDSATTIIYNGLLAGFASGLIPTLNALIQQKRYSWSGQPLGIFDKQSLLVLLSLPILTGLWGAIMGSFIATAVRNERAVYGWTVAAIFVPAVFTTVFLASTSLIIGLLVVVVSVFSLSAYLKIHKDS